MLYKDYMYQDQIAFNRYIYAPTTMELENNFYTDRANGGFYYEYEYKGWEEIKKTTTYKEWFEEQLKAGRLFEGKTIYESACLFCDKYEEDESCDKEACEEYQSDDGEVDSGEYEYGEVLEWSEDWDKDWLEYRLDIIVYTNQYGTIEIKSNFIAFGKRDGRKELQTIINMILELANANGISNKEISKALLQYIKED